jgi:uncharacterized protein (DUF1778 family)
MVSRSCREQMHSKASTMADTEARDQSIKIRATQHQRALIDQAARVQGKSRSEFMREAACRKAEEVLLDQTFFVLDDDAFDRFQEMLDNPPEPSEGLRKLMSMKPPWSED